MEQSYTLERAAYILGISEERVRDLITQNLVATIQENGEVRIPKKEIARLFEQLPSEEAQDAEKNDVRKALSTATPIPVNETEGVWVEDEVLLQIHEERKRCRERLRNLSQKIRRLTQKMERLRIIEAGENARFWDRACVLYPFLNSEGRFEAEEIDGRLCIHSAPSNTEDDFKERFREIIIEGMKKGHLPIGFLGIVPSEGDE